MLIIFWHNKSIKFPHLVFVVTEDSHKLKWPFSHWSSIWQKLALITILLFTWFITSSFEKWIFHFLSERYSISSTSRLLGGRVARGRKEGAGPGISPHPSSELSLLEDQPFIISELVGPREWAACPGFTEPECREQATPEPEFSWHQRRVSSHYHAASHALITEGNRWLISSTKRILLLFLSLFIMHYGLYF